MTFTLNNKFKKQEMIYYIFCDESGIGSHRYMTIGGVLLNKNSYNDINDTFDKGRQQLNMTSELKFSKITSQKINEYLAFSNYIFSLIDNDYIHFRCIVIDTNTLDKKQDKELTFHKLYYQLIYNCFIREILSDDNEIHLYFDQRSTSYNLNDFKGILQNHISRDNACGKVGYQHIKSVEYRDSKKENLVQIADLLTGCINFRTNNKQLLANTREAKINFVEEIVKKSGIDDWHKSTPINVKRFKIWHWKPRDK